MKAKQDQKLLHKMVYTYTLFFSVIFLLVMGFLYIALAMSSLKEASLSSQMLVRQPLAQLERYISETDDVAYKVMTNAALIKVLAELREENNPSNHFSKNVLDNIDTASVIAAQNSRVSPMRRIIVYNDLGDFISSGAIVDPEAVPRVLNRRSPSAMMDRFRKGELDWSVSLPKKDEWMSYFTDDYITLTRPVMNAYSRDVVGIVEVQQNKRLLEDLLRLAPDKPLLVNIYSESGEPVVLGQAEGNEVVATAVSTLCNWSVELLEPASARKGMLARLAAIMLVAWLLLDLAVYLIIGKISKGISKPLSELAEAVEAIAPGSQGRVAVDSRGIAEIGAVESAFNNMLERLTLSMEQEKKSFLLAMQAQMNPHFLYNVLSVANAMALKGRSDIVVKICANMSSMLRYASSYVTGSATLKEELEHTLAYLELMKSRYDYMFSYEANMDQPLEEVVVPKLIIQPICENCFTHSFSRMEPPYRISIQISGTPKSWKVRVEDNGCGFDEKKREQIVERANNASYSDLNRMGIGGLGLVSSVARLRLLTGLQATCAITGIDGGGSAVEIFIS
ncbi:MAG: histidine kinase [Clostridiales bacterium]|nr:histidine kinase [Clostridiales bacterium]